MKTKIYVTHVCKNKILFNSQNWLGDYGFTVSFNPQENVKGATWIVSSLLLLLFSSF